MDRIDETLNDLARDNRAEIPRMLSAGTQGQDIGGECFRFPLEESDDLPARPRVPSQADMDAYHAEGIMGEIRMNRGRDFAAKVRRVMEKENLPFTTESIRAVLARL